MIFKINLENIIIKKNYLNKILKSFAFLNPRNKKINNTNVKNVNIVLNCITQQGKGYLIFHRYGQKKLTAVQTDLSLSLGRVPILREAQVRIKNWRIECRVKQYWPVTADLLHWNDSCMSVAAVWCSIESAGTS